MKKTYYVQEKNTHNCTHIWRNLVSYESTGGILCSHQKLNLKGIIERKCSWHNVKWKTENEKKQVGLCGKIYRPFLSSLYLLYSQIF